MGLSSENSYIFIKNLNDESLNVLNIIVLNLSVSILRIITMN